MAFTDTKNASMSSRMAEFIRAWRCQLRYTPKDWDDKQALRDGSSTFPEWERFIDDARTDMGVVGRVLEVFEDSPTFHAFKNAYFKALGSSKNTGDICGACNGMRFLFAVRYSEKVQSGDRFIRVNHLIGPGMSRSRAAADATVTTVYCRCNPRLSNPGPDPLPGFPGHNGQAIGATASLAAAEYMADECRVMGGDVAIYGRMRPGVVAPLSGLENVDRMVEEISNEREF